MQSWYWILRGSQKQPPFNCPSSSSNSLLDKLKSNRQESLLVATWQAKGLKAEVHADLRYRHGQPSKPAYAASGSSCSATAFCMSSALLR